MTPYKSKNLRSITRKVCFFAVTVALFCFVDIRTARAMHSDSLHQAQNVIAHKAKHADEGPSSRDSAFPPSAPESSNTVAPPMVNQHALLQVRVSIDCALDDKAENSIRPSHDFGVAENAMRTADTSWFVQITELPNVAILIESSIHLNQAVDLKWAANNDYSFQGNASLSFLIPLADTALSGERTLIVSLMEYSMSGHSRIATRRLANLPVPPSHSATTKASNTQKTNPLLMVNLGTSTTCTSKSQYDSHTVAPEGTRYNKSIFTFVILGLGLFVYAAPKKTALLQENDEQVEQPHDPLLNETSSVEDEQESVSPPKLRRNIVIDSTVSNEEDESTFAEHDSQAAQQARQDSASSASRPKLHIIKPPSLVRIPFSFAAEQEDEATSTLSEASTDQRSMEGGSSRPEALPSSGANEEYTGEAFKQNATEQTEEIPVEELESVTAPGKSENPATVGGDVSQHAFPSPVVDAKETPAADNVIGAGSKNDGPEVALGSHETRMVAAQEGSEEAEPKANAVSKDVGGQLSLTVPDAPQMPNETPGGVVQELAKGTEGSHQSVSESCVRSQDTAGEPAASEVGFPAVSRNHAPSTSPANGTHTNETNTSQLAPGAPRASDTSIENLRKLGQGDADHQRVGEGQLLQDESRVVADIRQTAEMPECDQMTTGTDKNDTQPRVDEQEGPSLSGAEATPVEEDTDGLSAVDDEVPKASKPEPQSKVLAVEYVSVEESNWLRRLKNGPVSNGPPPAHSSNDLPREDQGARDEDKTDELSYVSTLPPDSDCNDGVDEVPFPFDSSPIFAAPRASTPNENQTNAARDETRPPRRKRRIGLLKSRNSSDQNKPSDESFETPNAVRPELDTARNLKSARSAPPPPPPAMLAQATTKNPSEATKTRLKKSPVDTIVPDVVPSIFLQSVANQISAPVPWDFTNASARPVVKKEKPSRRRRKRKGPPSSIEVLKDSPVPTSRQHSIVSRGSSQAVPRAKNQGSSKKTSAQVVGKKRRLLK